MPVEVEAKFRATDREPLTALGASPTLGPARLGPPRTFDEVDIYLDTAEGRLGAARWACRLRERDGIVRVSLKGPARDAGPPGGAIHHRPELEGPATPSFDPSAWPPSEARELLARLSGGGALRERFRLRQRRTEREVTLDGRRLGTLTLDEVIVAGDGRDLGAPLHVVELELDTDDEAALGHLERLSAALASRPGLVADPRTKLHHALERLGAP